MKLIALLLCFSAAYAQFEQDKAWQDWKLEFGKVFAKKEEAIRYTNWLKNKDDIEAHNANYEATYEQGLNEWSDMTQDEFEENYCNCWKFPKDASNQSTQARQHVPSNGPIADTVNWVEKGYVTAVKNQGHCGSCYSFSATGALEGQWFKKTGKLISMSEQQIVDCSWKYGNQGCHGGWYHACWMYIKDCGGIDSEASYGYTAKDSGFCRFRFKNVVAKVTGHVKLPHYDENALKEAVSSVGPIAVAIDSTRPGFRNYKRGVFYDPWCSSRHLTHAVLAVGYGTENGQDYWLVKNSWGTKYGAGGYVKMARNRNNHCGIATKPAYPTV